MSSMQRTLSRSKRRLPWTKKTWNAIERIGAKIQKENEQKREVREARRNIKKYSTGGNK